MADDDDTTKPAPPPPDPPSDPPNGPPKTPPTDPDKHWGKSTAIGTTRTLDPFPVAAVGLAMRTGYRIERCPACGGALVLHPEFHCGRCFSCGYRDREGQPALTCLACGVWFNPTPEQMADAELDQSGRTAFDRLILRRNCGCVSGTPTQPIPLRRRSWRHCATCGKATMTGRPSTATVCAKCERVEDHDAAHKRRLKREREKRAKHGRLEARELKREEAWTEGTLQPEGDEDDEGED